MDLKFGVTSSGTLVQVAVCSTGNGVAHKLFYVVVGLMRRILSSYGTRRTELLILSGIGNEYQSRGSGGCSWARKVTVGLASHWPCIRLCGYIYLRVQWPKKGRAAS